MQIKRWTFRSGSIRFQFFSFLAMLLLILLLLLNVPLVRAHGQDAAQQTARQALKQGRYVPLENIVPFFIST